MTAASGEEAERREEILLADPSGRDTVDRQIGEAWEERAERSCPVIVGVCIALPGGHHRRDSTVNLVKQSRIADPEAKVRNGLLVISRSGLGYPVDRRARIAAEDNIDAPIGRRFLPLPIAKWTEHGTHEVHSAGLIACCKRE